MNTVTLGYTDIALAALLIAINAGLSIIFRLRLEHRLLIAALRMVVQLSLVGLVLKALFTAQSAALTGITALVMVGFAGYEIHARQERPFLKWWTQGIGTGSVLIGGALVTLFALTTQIDADPWHDPRYAIPLFGMILGNTMTGVAIGLDRLISGAIRERAAIEARLALGHSRAEAFREIVRDAVRSGLIPTINMMAAAGLVSLPGMMTGQILAGAAPTEAVKLQILIIFLIAGASGLGLFASVLTAARLLSDDRHRLRLDRLRAAPNK